MIGSAIFNEYFSEDKLSLIARGGFSQIFITECNLTKQLIVIKKMKNDDESTLNFLSQEANWIKRLNEENSRFKNIIKIYSQIQLGNCIYIAMEYCPIGSLEKLLISKQKLNHIEILIFAKQMISALIYAHKLGLVHSDLKPENVLIRSPNEYVLTDWGSAQQLNHQHSTTLRDNTYFTPGYQAPELQNENLISSNMKFNYFIADIYSLGMMLLRCTGPSFREIRTISSEADQGDHDWKINKLFKTYIFQKEYQDGVVDKIIGGFLNYSKVSRMKLEEALMLINQVHPHLESYIEKGEIPNQGGENQNYARNGEQGFEQSIYESIALSKLKISTTSVQNSNPAISLQYNNHNHNSNTILKKQLSSYRNNISSFNQQAQNERFVAQSNQIDSIFKQPNSLDTPKLNQPDSLLNNQPANNITFTNVQNNKMCELYSTADQMSNSNISSSNSSGSGSNQSSKKIDKDCIDGKPQSRSIIREIKRNKSAEKFRINKNISISYINELLKLTPDVDSFKAYLSNQVNDGNIQLLSQKLDVAHNIRKLFLCIGGSNDFTDFSIYQLQNVLSNKKQLQEFTFDITNSQKTSLQAVNSMLKEIPLISIDTISLSLSKTIINEGDFDELVAILFNLPTLKRINISFSQCTSISEDDIDFICEQAEDNDNIDRFYLICPKNAISEEKASILEKQLSNQISDVKITVSC